MFCYDFETKGIEPRPAYPPLPVGLAVHGRYMGWGHPEGNNSGLLGALSTLKANWNGPMLAHNAAFDIAVATECMRLPLPPGKHVNDTMILAFLLDPYGDLSLKPLAERYLGVPPTERDAVRDWLYANKVIPKNVKRWGAHISAAPGGLVGPYAIGDVARTEALFKHLAPMVRAQGMWEAYRRECDIMPMLLDNSAQGIPLDHARLKRDTVTYEASLVKAEAALRKYWRDEIGSTAPGNFDSGDELADALMAGGIVLPKTPTGKTSTAKESLLAALPDGKVKGLLLYRSAIEKCLSTYMRTWLLQGKALHANWNQVRDYADNGARTGRLSSSPNLQNLTNPEKYDQLAALMKQWGCRYSWATFPNLRSYIQAPKGFMLFSRDYSQQELRMLAHFEDGVLAQAYRDDPDLDLHDFVAALIQSRTGMPVLRKSVKTINFAKIYGAGRAKLAAQLGLGMEATNELMDAYEAALPSVKELQDDTKARGAEGDFITTLGGRRYFTKPAERIDGRLRTYEYVLLNTLIQGSSADQTKEAMRLWSPAVMGTDTRFLMSVHDQLIGMAPKRKVKQACEELGECMRDAFTLSVPVKSDPTYGQNFGEMK